MTRPSRLRTLVLHADYTTRLSYYDDWLDALSRAPQFDARSLNICQRGVAPRLRAELADAELVVLLHSTNGDTTVYLEPFAGLLADRRGLLLSFVGNEVNLPGSPIAAKRAVLGRIAPDYIATQLPLEAGQYLWGDLVRRRVLALPHALNPQAFRPELPAQARPIHIGVRAARYLPHLGDCDRNTLHDLFERHAFEPALVVDIGSERLDRPGWAAFLNRCLGTVSTEAGSWWIERDDATINAIRAWTAARTKGKAMVIANDSPLRRLGHKLPWWLRAALRRILSRGVLRHESTITESLPFDEVYDRFFRNRPRPPVYGKCLSSRHLDAIGTGTCQILMTGRYNDILRAGDHYIPLAPDFSDVDEAMRRFRDAGERQRIARTAHEHVLDGHTYDHRIAQLAQAVTSG
ncbi:MAG TPA: glycosyltransferase [Magnetospirillum sp.]|nr:glycosyltransferase [Magnetospirillum sp.]